MDSLILEKNNSENQDRQYTSHKHVANIEWWANHKKKNNQHALWDRRFIEEQNAVAPVLTVTIVAKLRESVEISYVYLLIWVLRN